MKKPLIILISLSLSSCLNPIKMIEEARKQSIIIESPLVEGASCRLTDMRGQKWFLASTPGVVTVRTGYDPIAIICKKNGYKTFVDRINTNHLVHLQSPLSIADNVIGTFHTPYGNFFKDYRYHYKVFMEPKAWPSNEYRQEWLEAKLEWEEEELKLRAEEYESEKQQRIENRITNKVTRIKSLHPYGMRAEDDEIEQQFKNFKNNKPYNDEGEFEGNFDDFKLFLFDE